MPWKDKRRNTDAVLDRVARNRALIAAIKEAAPCADCGVSYPSYVMEFDHTGTDKFLNVSDMVGYGWKRIADEIAKCDLVCSNCHKVRTHIRRNK